jgi:hypothetical protein
LGAENNSYLEPGHWQVSLAYRWLHSDRHFRGGHEEPQRQANGSEVINDVHTIDLSTTYALSRRLDLTFTLPFVTAERSSKYEHLGNSTANPRFTTSAGGVGDVRLVGNFWVLPPENHPNGNISLGLGVKAPTGDDAATDTFTRKVGGKIVGVERPVDQSIQPGDGGWGLLLEMQGFQKLFRRAFGYLTASYLMNPAEHNQTQTPNSTPASPTYLSVTDAYLLRIGLTHAVWPAQGLSLSLGGRMEGVPARDAIGGSQGFRRPGYAISIEPGLSWAKGKYLVNLTAPVALERNREWSVPNLASGAQGDAAFADFLILLSVSRRF